MNRILFLKCWSVAMGSMDAMTGLVLIFFPGRVLGILRIPAPPAASLVYLSWIGVFVMSVGLSYAMALGNRIRGETVWAFTAMVRLMVAGFLTYEIVAGEMPLAWAPVGLSDGVVGMVQLVILRRNWWKEVAG